MALTLEDLSSDILFYLFKFLQPQELCPIPQLNKRFWTFFRCKQVWKRRAIEDFGILAREFEDDFSWKEEYERLFYALKKVINNQIDLSEENGLEIDMFRAPYRASQPLVNFPLGDFSIAYFEMKIEKAKEGCNAGLGLAEKDFSWECVGWELDSYGVHGDGYAIYNAEVIEEIKKFVENDIIGMGLNFRTNQIFWTLNGQVMRQDTRTENIPLYPFVSFFDPGKTEVSVNFGQKPFCFDIINMMKIQKKIEYKRYQNYPSLQNPATFQLWKKNEEERRLASDITWLDKINSNPETELAKDVVRNWHIKLWQLDPKQDEKQLTKSLMQKCIITCNDLIWQLWDQVIEPNNDNFDDEDEIPSPVFPYPIAGARVNCTVLLDPSFPRQSGFKRRILERLSEIKNEPIDLGTGICIYLNIFWRYFKDPAQFENKDLEYLPYHHPLPKSQQILMLMKLRELDDLEEENDRIDCMLDIAAMFSFMIDMATDPDEVHRIMLSFYGSFLNHYGTFKSPVFGEKSERF